eukprot:gene32019-16542_t
MNERLQLLEKENKELRAPSPFACVLRSEQGAAVASGVRSEQEAAVASGEQSEQGAAVASGVRSEQGAAVASGEQSEHGAAVASGVRSEQGAAVASGVVELASISAVDSGSGQGGNEQSIEPSHVESLCATTHPVETERSEQDCEGLCNRVSSDHDHDQQPSVSSPSSPAGPMDQEAERSASFNFEGGPYNGRIGSEDATSGRVSDIDSSDPKKSTTSLLGVAQAPKSVTFGAAALDLAAEAALAAVDGPGSPPENPPASRITPMMKLSSASQAETSIAVEPKAAPPDVPPLSRQIDPPPSVEVCVGDAEHDEEVKAAISIQRRFRGFVARKQQNKMMAVAAMTTLAAAKAKSSLGGGHWGLLSKIQATKDPAQKESKWAKARTNIEHIKLVQQASAADNLSPISGTDDDGLGIYRRSLDYPVDSLEPEDGDKKADEETAPLLGLIPAVLRKSLGRSVRWFSRGAFELQRVNSLDSTPIVVQNEDELLRSKKKRWMLRRQHVLFRLWAIIVSIFFQLPGSQRLARKVLTPLHLRLTLQVQKLTNSADVRVRAAILVAISVANICVGATIYKLVTGVSWNRALFKVYSILFNAPGTDVTAEPTFIGSLVANIIFMTGILVFAVLLGMIGEEVGNQIMALRSGTGKLRLDRHILLLNWNYDLVPVLRQLIAAARCRSHVYHGRTIVILADKEKHILDADVLAAISRTAGGEASNLEIHTRSGKPYRVADLQLVSAAEAAYVIMLYPASDSHTLSSASIPFAEHGKAEAMKAATVAAMSTLGKFNNKNLIVQVPHDIPPEHQQLEAVQDLLAAEGLAVQVVRISEAKLVDRLVAQTALQPGVLTVLKLTLRQGVDYRYVWINVTEGKGGSFSELRRRYLDVIVLGYLSSAGVGTEEIPNSPLHLNPDETDMVVPGDKLVALARDHIVSSGGPRATPDMARPTYEKASQRAVHRISRMRTDEVPGKRVLVIGWPTAALGQLVEGINAFAAPGTQITFVLNRRPGLHNMPEVSGKTMFKFIERNVSSMIAIESFACYECARAVCKILKNMDSADADALVLSALFQIQRMAADIKHRVHVVAKAYSSNTKKVAKEFFKGLTHCYVTFELIIPNQMTSAILTQIVEAGRLLQMSVLGYSQEGGMIPILAPPMDSFITLCEGDKFVVVADLVQ